MFYLRKLIHATTIIQSGSNWARATFAIVRTGSRLKFELSLLTSVDVLMGIVLIFTGCTNGDCAIMLWIRVRGFFLANIKQINKTSQPRSETKTFSIFPSNESVFINVRSFL